MAMRIFKTSKHRSSLALILLSAFFMTFLTACGSLTGNTGSSPFTLSFLGDKGGTDSSTSGDSKQLLAGAALKHNPTGTTNLSWNPENGVLTVKITLFGLAPNSSHAAHIHAGNCQSNGDVVYALNPVVADDHGNAIAETTTIEDVAHGIPASGWYINVHNGLGMSELGHRPISCANIHNSKASKKTQQFVRVRMKGTIAPNEAASGVAKLTKEHGKYVLRITMTGLAHNSEHVAHIHTGNCKLQGPPVVMLNPVVADRWGNGTSVTTFDQLPSSSNGLYVNVHTGATMNDLKQSPLFFNPIACGNLS